MSRFGRGLRRLASAVLASLVLSGMAAGAAGTAPPGLGQGPAGAGAPLPADARGGLSAGLVGVRIVGPQYEAGVARFHAAGAAAARAVEQRGRAKATLVRLEGERVAIEDRRARFTAAEQAAAEALAAARRRLQDLAVAAYVQGGRASELTLLLDARTAADLARRRRLVDAVHEEERAVAAAHRGARDAASAEVAVAVADLEANAGATARAEAVARQAAEMATRAQAEREAARQAVARTAPAGRVAGTDLPVVALDAYRRAADRAGTHSPGCGVGWSALAGIGRVESRHGSFRRSRAAVDGTVTPPVIGIPLDGTDATRVVADTDGGRLDGDAALDRAVGPMQFIPSTWRRFGGDGNGDGVSDPQNLYDAALAASRYLCLGGVALGSDDALWAAFRTYNLSDAYADAVLRWTRSYAATPLG